MLYYLKNTDLIECMMGMLDINLELVGEGLLSHIENLDTSRSLLHFKDYSCLDKLLST